MEVRSKYKIYDCMEWVNGQEKDKTNKQTKIEFIIWKRKIIWAISGAINQSLATSGSVAVIGQSREFPAVFSSVQS